MIFRVASLGDSERPATRGSESHLPFAAVVSRPPLFYGRLATAAGCATCCHGGAGAFVVFPCL